MPGNCYTEALPSRLKKYFVILILLLTRGHFITARKEGISVDEVRCEIQKAIDDAMQSDDPAVQAYWKKIKYKGEKPTPEEVVLYIAKQVKAY